MRLMRKWGDKIMRAVSMALGIDPPNDDELLYRGDDHDARCMVGMPMICSAMHRCPVCAPLSPEFDGRGGGVRWWPDANGVLQPYDAKTNGGWTQVEANMAVETTYWVTWRSDSLGPQESGPFHSWSQASDYTTGLRFASHVQIETRNTYVPDGLGAEGESG